MNDETGTSGSTPLHRRALLRLALGGGVGAAIASLLGVSRGDAHADGARPSPGPDSRHRGGSPYAHGVEPPPSLGPGALDRWLRPPPADSRVRRHEHRLVITERPMEIARDVTTPVWCFDGGVPGPVLRATEGDELSLHCVNLGARPHNLHLHGRHDPGEDGWEPIPARGEKSYRLRAQPFGLHPYHCHVMDDHDHAAMGLYGAMIVDPPGGRAPAHELVLVLGGYDADGDGRDELYAWNGVPGFFARHPIRVPAGELVRLYLVNMAMRDAAASFHLHAATFDVYRTGTRLTPDDHTDVVTLGPAERAILEFRLPDRGRYMFHPHHAHMARGGAMGWISAI